MILALLLLMSNHTYFENRMLSLGISGPINECKIRGLDWVDLPDGSKQQQVINIVDDRYFKHVDNVENFPPSERELVQDGIYITYLTLNGHWQQFTPEGNKFPKHFYRVRMHPSKEKPDQKYVQPANSGTNIYLTPGILQKYAGGVKMTTLYCVEGEFKAFKGFMNGLDIVGLSGYHGFHKKDDPSLHPDLLEIIRVCKPDNIVLLLDNDVFDINWDKWQRDKDYDLGKRLTGFWSAVKDFREAAKGVVRDVYFMHIQSDVSSKGLDDLFIDHPLETGKILQDLNCLAKARDYFTGFNLISENSSAIKHYFLLDTSKFRAPQNFYRRYQQEIGAEEFFFNSFRFKYNSREDQLELVRHADSEEFIRVGCNYLKIIWKLKPNGRDLQREFKEWRPGEITRDYVNAGYKNFFTTIEKFDDFENEPCNLPDKFRQWIPTKNGKRLYNIYHPIEHVAAPGDWTNIRNYFIHIFGNKKLIEIFPPEVVVRALTDKEKLRTLEGEELDKYIQEVAVIASTVTQLDLGLDWATLIYLHPKQKLPILSLYSKPRNTGKSTMIDLQREILGSNATSLGNDDIEDVYNDDFVSKKVIGIEETILEKPKAVEKLKNWATNPRINMHGKFKGRSPINFYGTFILTSNNKNFLKIESEEVRFWVREIPVLTDRDPNMLEKMTAEIPAFLHYMQQRPVMFPKRDRQWFEPEILRTEALDNVVAESRSYAYKVIKKLLIDLFFEFDIIEYKINLKILRELVNDKTAGIKLSDSQIQKVMEDDLGYTMGKNQRFEFYESKASVENGVTNFYMTEIKVWKDGKPIIGTPYTVKASDFILEEEYSVPMKEKLQQQRELAKQTTLDLKDPLPF